MINLKSVYKRHQNFWRFVISYIVLLVVTISIGSYTYNEALRIVKQDAAEAVLSVLEQSKDTLDSNMREVENMTIQLSLDDRVREFSNIKQPLTGVDYEKIRVMLNDLPSYRLTNSFIIDTYIFFKNSNVVVSSTFASARMSLLYNQVLKYEDMSYREWRNRILQPCKMGMFWPAQKVTINSNKLTVITYLRSIPLDYYNNFKGAIIVLINQSQINKLFSSLLPQEGGWFYIIDRKGNIISSINTYANPKENLSINTKEPNGIMEQVISGKKMIVVYTTSKYNGWRYVAALPYQVFMNKVEYIKTIYLITALIALMVGISIACWYAYQNSRPLKVLIKKLKEGVEREILDNEDTYDYLEGSISKLIVTNKDLKNELERQTPLLRVAFFDRLLRLGFNSYKEIYATLAYIRLKIQGPYFIVLLIHIGGFNGEVSEEILNELDMVRVVVNNVLKSKTGDRGYLHNIENDKVSLLLEFGYDEYGNYEKKVKDLANAAVDELCEYYGIRAFVGVGNLYRDLTNVNKSFEEANQALEYRYIEKDRRIIWFKDIPKECIEYYYPLDVELRLTNYVKMGDIQEVKSILNNIYRRNYIQIRLSYNMMHQLLYEMRGTILKLKNQIIFEDCNVRQEIDKMIGELDNWHESPDDLYEKIVDIFKYICEKVDNQKRSHNVTLRKKIIEYIDLHYMEEDLCLCSIAAEFDLSEKYLSRFFKEQTGENYSSYLEKVRMKHALKLLLDTDYTVSQIVKQTGYSSTNTFHKAFKRVFGVSPGTYRNKNRPYTEETVKL